MRMYSRDKNRILRTLFYEILSKRSPGGGYVLTKFCKIKSSNFEFYGGCIVYKWGCIFYERMKKVEKQCLLFEPRSSRCDVQIILDSLAKSRRKFGVRPRKIFFSEKSFFRIYFRRQKLRFMFFGELQPR